MQSQNLLYLLNESGQIHMIPATIDDMYVIRFCVNYKDASINDIEEAWNIIRKMADKVIEALQRGRQNSMTRANQRGGLTDASTPTLRQPASAASHNNNSTSNNNNNSSSHRNNQLSYWAETVSRAASHSALNQMRSVDSWLGSRPVPSQRRLSNYSCKSEDNLDDLTATGEEEIESPLRKPLFC